MARGNTYKCVVCGKERIFCPKCQIVLPDYDYERYCSKAHSDIFAILSKHGCGLETAKETIAALLPYDTTNLVESVAKHIDSLNEETKREVEHDEPTQE